MYQCQCKDESEFKYLLKVYSSLHGSDNIFDVDEKNFSFKLREQNDTDTES